ncbi:hypothetical protein VKT23_016271 [Stygiomarasmius scandens]|uniref:Uncharacterized protein n=1 Tax=Marasmiellus scandens TaxID=2682957 RepID=A0ABR1IZK1_9AGAR
MPLKHWIITHSGPGISLDTMIDALAEFVLVSALTYFSLDSSQLLDPDNIVLVTIAIFLDALTSPVLYKDTMVCSRDDYDIAANHYADAPPFEDLFNLLASSLVMSFASAAANTSSNHPPLNLYSSMSSKSAQTQLFRDGVLCSDVRHCFVGQPELRSGRSSFCRAPYGTGQGSPSKFGSGPLSLGKSEGPLLGFPRGSIAKGKLERVPEPKR